MVFALLTLAPGGALAQELPPLPPPPGPFSQTAGHPQPGPWPTSGSSFRTVDYVPEQVVRLEAAPGYQLMVEFAPDEHIETVAVGDSGAWQVTANKRGDRLFVKPLQDGVATNMTVVTDARLYAFALEPLSGSQPDMAYAVRFRYAAPARAADATPQTAAGHYKLSGDRNLLPSAMHDDGVHTYVAWDEDRPIPAIYALDARGRETLVNGMMRDDRMVIDSVHNRLVFRIDNHKATARRVAVGTR